MKRWLSEFFHPSRKCERLGHDMGEVRQRVYLYPAKHWDHVADDVVEVTPQCRRCRHRGETKIKKRSGLHGLTMSGDRWDTLKSEGRLVQ